jgi:hypothetical protein
MKFDIIEYFGKIDNGVLVIISLNYNDVHYDSTFYYKENYVAITIDEELEYLIGVVEEWDGYNKLILDIMSKVIPYDEIINRLDVLDVSEYDE